MTIELTSIKSFSISLDIDSYCYTFNASLSTVDDWSLCEQGQEIIFILDSDEYIFILDSREKSQSFLETTYTIKGRSKTSILGEDRSELITKTWDAVNVSEVFTEICSQVGLTHQFLIQDWTLPKGLLVAEGETPLSILQRLATAAGGILQPSIAGELLVIPAYEISPADFDSGTPEYTYSDEEDILALSESRENFPKYNKVTVTNISGTDSNIYGITEIQDETLSVGMKLIRVTVYPWMEEVNLSTSFDLSMVNINPDPNNPKILEQEEYVTIIQGEGGVSFPIKNIIETYYIHKNLGEISFKANQISTESKEQSLLYIKYETEAHDFIIYLNSNADQDKVLIYMEEEE